MATVNIITGKKMQTRAGLAFILSYCSREEKTEHNGRLLVSGVGCIADSAYQEFMNTKLQYGKTDGRMFYHVFQSFHPDDPLTPETAHEIALKLAEQFDGYEVLVATHCDKEHLHSHFVINSVGFENGKKFHADKDFLANLRQRSDELCLEYGLSVIKRQKEKQPQRMSAREYRSADKGQSWKMQLAVQIDEAMKYARSREDFIEIMRAESYEVKWTDTRKNITYTTPDGKKCCDDKLHEEKYLKGNMEYEFRIRQEILGGIEETGNRTAENSIEGRAVRNGFGSELESDYRFTGDSNRDAGTASREAEHADDRAKSARLYEPTAELFDRVNRENDSGGAERREKNASDTSEFSAENAVGDDGIYRENEDGSIGFVLTGWERERSVFEEAILSEGRDEAFYQTAVSDFSDPVSVIGGAVSLAVEAGSIIENDHPVQDSTTIHYPQKKKKEQQSGPVMGGM